MKESLVLSSCIKWLYWQGCDFVRQNTGGTVKEYTTKAGIKKTYRMKFGKPGLEDISAISPYGRWIAVECKSDTGKLKPEQEARKIEVERRNGVYILARSQDDLEARKRDILARIEWV